MFTKKFELRLYVPATWEPSGDMPTRWRDNLKNAAEILHSRLVAKIPDDGTYINEMVTRANKEYAGMLNPGFISKGGRTAERIREAHAKNMGKRFTRWLTNLNKAFETKDGVPAKAFKDKVDASIDNWAIEAGDKILRLTGDKIRGRSVAPIVAFYLVGDERATSWTKQGDTVDGLPYSITSELERTAVKAAVQQRLVQGGMLVINSEYQPAVIAEQNAVNASLLSKMRDPARADAFVVTPAPDKCYCSWEMENNLLVLHVQVGITVP
ncbi:MAG: hypothetical protein HZA49_09120 [Planctomycetes bacterium]|nr:hypothetical protein [Planctomycetota bacterium]